MKNIQLDDYVVHKKRPEIQGIVTRKCTAKMELNNSGRCLWYPRNFKKKTKTSTKKNKKISWKSSQKKIHEPPEWGDTHSSAGDFSECEDNWSEEYQPSPSILKWKDKKAFCDQVTKIESHIRSHNKTNYRLFYTIFRSAIDGTKLGSGVYYDEFEGQTICWKVMYARHYIQKHNVMPSERFFRFVVSFDFTK